MCTVEPTRLGTAECRAHAEPWWGCELNPSNKANGKPRESPRSQILWWPETGYNIWIRNWLELWTLWRTRLALNVGGTSQWAGSGELRRLGQPKLVLCFLAAPSSCCYSAPPSQVTGTPSGDTKSGLLLWKSEWRGLVSVMVRLSTSATLAYTLEKSGQLTWSLSLAAWTQEHTQPALCSTPLPPFF